jgi:hypothetical protein
MAAIDEAFIDGAGCQEEMEIVRVHRQHSNKSEPRRSRNRREPRIATEFAPEMETR